MLAFEGVHGNLRPAVSALMVGPVLLSGGWFASWTSFPNEDFYVTTGVDDQNLPFLDFFFYSLPKKTPTALHWRRCSTHDLPDGTVVFLIEPLSTISARA